MKMWLTSILLLLVVTATLCPCYLKDDCCNDEFLCEGANHSSHRSECNCSPFVTCGTCAGFAINIKIVEIPIITAEKPIHHSNVISFLLAAYSTSFFQPPRVA
jgi:hypothetical protein